jgi:hypothetical protein
MTAPSKMRVPRYVSWPLQICGSAQKFARFDPAVTGNRKILCAPEADMTFSFWLRIPRDTLTVGD